MPQPPFLVDQIDIEPGSAGTRRINRDAATGGLAFQDAVVTSPLVLQQLANLTTITNVAIVGKTGAGAQYTTIQAALDAVPSAASATNPYIIIVMPGVYDETVNIVRDGVRLIGIGKPVLRSALETTPDAGGNDHTLIISAQLGTIPKNIVIEGMVITNAHADKACVRIVGAAGSTVGNDQILLKCCDLQANSATGNRHLWATAVNFICLEGGNFTEDAANLGLLLMEEVAGLDVNQVTGIGGMSLRFDTVNDVPSEASVGYTFLGCGSIAPSTLISPPILGDFAGDGQLVFDNCTVPAGTTFSGDQTVLFTDSIVGELTLLETVTVDTSGGVTDGVSAVNAGASYDERQRNDTAVFGAATTVVVAFDVPFSDAVFDVFLELDTRPVSDESPWITAKAATGFTINFFSAQTMSVRWRTFRN